MSTDHHRKNLPGMRRSLLRARETGDQAEETVGLDPARI